MFKNFEASWLDHSLITFTSIKEVFEFKISEQEDGNSGVKDHVYLLLGEPYIGHAFDCELEIFIVVHIIDCVYSWLV